MLTVERLRELLHYDPETGTVVWIAAASKYRSVPLGGSAVGTFRDKDGYAIIKVGGVSRRAHRVIWALMTGKWPEGQIDHINRVTDDNRWCNLREATISQNGANKKCQNSSGLKGVSLERRNNNKNTYWRASITKDQKSIKLGYFPTKEAAHAAYVEAATRLHGEFARPE